MKAPVLKAVFLFALLGFVVMTANTVGPKPTGKVSFVGTIKTGAQLGEGKSYCLEGFYLVADEGTYLVGQTSMLQLRLADQSDGTKMFSEQKYAGKKVKVTGQYPAQEVFCEALMCECDDYLLVDYVSVVD